MLSRSAGADRRSSNDSGFLRAVLDGLSKPRKSLPCRYLYDATGSALFEKITALPEYYPTRSEVNILEAHAREMMEGIPCTGALIEFGSGTSIKTELLLRHLPAGVSYVAIDVSPSALAAAQKRLARRFPHIAVHPIVADFSEPIELTPDVASRPKVGFFPGSTIGNWSPREAMALLSRFAHVLRPQQRLVIGVDLKKNAKTLVRAYDDAQGVTAAFNRNLIVRMNRELGTRIDVESFCHKAIYDPYEGRVEMHLVSAVEQEIVVGGKCFRFRSGESIHTESSYKYTVGEFQDLARAAGWTARRVWIDQERKFSVHELTG